MMMRKHKNATDNFSTNYIQLTSSSLPTMNELSISEIESEENVW